MDERRAKQTLADQAYDQLADAIVAGDLEPGARISELALATQFGISRGPLREALRRLEGRKLVVARPRAGVRVVSLSTRDMLELFEIRQSLEALACRLATERMSEDEVDALERLLDLHDREPLVGRAHSRQQNELDFHFHIANHCRNRQLIELLCGQLFDLMRVYRYKSSGKPGRAVRAFDEHREIFAAIRRRDAEEASERMRRHVRQSWMNLLREEGIADAMTLGIAER